MLEPAKNLKSTTTLQYSRYELDNNTYFKNIFSNFQKGYKYAKTDKYTLLQDFSYNFEKHMLSAGASFDFFDIIPRGPDLKSPYDTSKSSYEQDLVYIGTAVEINFNQYNYKNIGFYMQDNYNNPFFGSYFY
jgi:hypothetical protein